MGRKDKRGGEKKKGEARKWSRLYERNFKVSMFRKAMKKQKAMVCMASVCPREQKQRSLRVKSLLQIFKKGLGKKKIK